MDGRQRAGRVATRATAGCLILLVTGCAGGISSGQQSTQESGIVLGSGTTLDTPGASPGNPSTTSRGPGPSAADPLADLDIDDQRGDGTRVVVESLSASRQGVMLVLLDEKGRTVAEIPVTPGVQPVTIPLDPPLARSQELRGMLMAADGSGILVDSDGEAVEEDFDYLIR